MNDTQKLAAIRNILAQDGTVNEIQQDKAATAPGPGIAPGGAPTAGSLNWWRNPGAPVVEGVAAYDDIPTCKRYAAQGYGPGGTRTLQPDELATMLDLCDKLGADTQTAEGAEALVEHAATCDTDSAIYALLTGWSQGSSFGKPSLFIGQQRIADLVKKAQTSAAGPSGR